MTPIPFQRDLTVTSKHLDEQNHVNNLEYMKWVLEISEAHWVAETSIDIRKKYAWFVLDHYIQYRQQAFLGEELVLTTWLENYSKIRSERRVHITRKSDDKTIIEARTNWCFIDQQTKKPARITAEIVNPFFEFESA
ncbi:acyl-CoA thioesterase [Psychroflexus sediminis]|uniref:Acyl-CoA thioester hydrolase n=1 Tax=Psychroflexus sediminis TaxID=470826 RepID=A0A1G7U0T3_9FLAO|nr:acyl-ACP thioesterase domain-containing protein [Psychroflexus sediminis]SDG41007.1 acyl-CoA thioester hydrolase [Psychroflexus sediminis]